MSKYRIASKSYATEHVLVLDLKPVNPAKAITFQPGQYAALGFKRFGRPTPMRCFSMINTPGQSGNLQFGVDVQGNFTTSLSGLDMGDEINVKGPYGNFVVDPDYDKQIVLLAGGIGITPILSLLNYIDEAHLKIPTVLLYGCRSLADVAFYQELKSISERNPNIQVNFFISNGFSSKPAGNFFNGQIKKEHLSKLTSQNNQSISYFLCGPNSFMNNFKSILTSYGVPEYNIFSESFTQVTKISKKGVGKHFSIQTLTYATSALAMFIVFVTVMAIDISKEVPKIANAQAATVNQTSTTVTPSTQPTNNATSSTPSTDTTTTSPTNTTTPTSTSDSNQTSSTPVYQAPVTSVS